MTADDAIRFVAYQAQRCHERDSHEALCLLMPSLLNVLHLPPMDYREALAFEIDLRAALREQAHVMTGAEFQ